MARDDGFVRQEPPADIKTTVNQLSALSVCGQTFTLVWTHGPKRGLPVTVYCVEPLCIEQGACTGPRFIPHLQQYTAVDTDDPKWGPRKLMRSEVIAAVREVSKQAEAKGASRLVWSDKMIVDYVKLVWAKTLAAVKGDGDPKSGWTR